MNHIFILFITLCLSMSAALATENYDCSDKNIEIKTKGFVGYGAEAKKMKSIGRLSVITSEASIYQRSFEIGRYRFVKENDKWAVYRKNDQGTYELRKDIAFPVKVSVDQPLYVSQRDKNVLEVRRNTDDTNSTSINIIFGRDKISATEPDGNHILNYSLCPTAAKEGTGANSKTPPVKTNH